MTTHPGRVAAALLSLTVLAAAGVTQLSPAAAAPPRTGRYIVRTTSSPAATQHVRELRDSGNAVRSRYSRVLNGFAGRFTAAQVRRLKSDPSVTSVTPDVRISIDDGRRDQRARRSSSSTQAIAIAQADSTQTSAPWGLDRIDQRATARDGRFHYDTTGRGVTAFVIDSGVSFSHRDFGGRAVSGYDFDEGDNDASDCEGHGTHVAGTIGGTTYGVAKQVRIVSLRVFDCAGEGYLSDFIAALDWAVDHKPAGGSVVNFSGGGPIDAMSDEAVANTIRAGIPVVVAAGNEHAPACNSTPARVPAAITVAASDSADRQPDFTNYGSCVDLFAPGVNITSLGIDSTTDTQVLSGTSMASPHVAGAVARYLQGRRSATPAQVTTALLASTTRDAVQLTQSTPNRLLFSSTASRSYTPTDVQVARTP